ncbi:EAL domain-containing protein (putative c-di-GMP-specific phosphodiesterase class I) [Malaciobacter marinus]|jgi:EAL domain-containing protein (putative c-di-GMP-specific phosphodiesterase class I)|nr:EAL domain-containing protein (putative c-di-GMP-specific phosphodiesterase class I) [Malaciobacter marinus]
MRVFDKDNNMIMPYVFIQKSKKYRLYNNLMAILIEKVVSYINKYKINISINLDFHDILNPKIKDLLIEKIKNNNVGEYLTLEILESDKISNYSIVNEFIKEVKKYGVKIAIDDFGTGFSNYEYILNIDVDYIKIDGSLIKKIDQEIYLNLVKSIVLFCKQQNFEVVAEFVSDLKILRYIRSLGIEYAQGYYISKPKPIETIVGELNEKNS